MSEIFRAAGRAPVPPDLGPHGVRGLMLSMCKEINVKYFHIIGIIQVENVYEHKNCDIFTVYRYPNI